MKCLICGKDLKIINNLHLKYHDITVKEYETMFPNSQRYNDNILKIMSEKAKINQTGRKYSNESKLKMSVTRKKKILSGEIITPFMIEDKFGDNNPAWGKNRHSNQEIIDLKEKNSKILSTIFSNNYKYKYGKFFSEKLNKTFHYRSSYELRFFSILENLDDLQKYDYESIRIPYNYNGITYTYVPDFLIIPNNDIMAIVEAGTYTFKIYKDNKTKAKHNAAVNYCIQNNMNFLIVTEKELNKMDNMKNRMNCWKALKSFCHNEIGNDNRDGLKSKRICG